MRIAVVIPARDEEELLPRCLASVLAAADRSRREPGVSIDVIVVADRSTDRTAEIGRAAGVLVLETDDAAVGAARRVGIEAAITMFGSEWICNTDADSEVPPHWFEEQLRLAREGADVVVGTVQPDAADLSPDQLERWRRTRTPGIPNGHIHGANLGLRVTTYLAADGFAPVAEHEDVDLVSRCAAQGARIVATDRADVLTSGRLEGRTPGGYARYLANELPA
ncbi:glycosyltransferase family A protein [soil metagenome]